MDGKEKLYQIDYVVWYKKLKLIQLCYMQVVSNPIFKETPIFVLLNKKDLFEQMIKKTSLKACFSDYNGPDFDVKSALKYVESSFADILKESCPEKPLYIKVRIKNVWNVKKIRAERC